jgi:hypothetical protein
MSTCYDSFVHALLLQLLLSNTSEKVLVICFTNHALDSFMEALEAGGSTSMVRIGGKCQSDSLVKYQLREIEVSALRCMAVRCLLHSSYYMITVT